MIFVLIEEVIVQLLRPVDGRLNGSFFLRYGLCCSLRPEGFSMAEGQNKKSPDAAPLRAGIEEISGVKKEDIENSIVESRKSLRSAIDWVQSNYGILIAAGLGVATVGFVTLWLNRRDGLRHFYEEEAANPTLH
jgi:hypothetical protein